MMIRSTLLAAALGVLAGPLAIYILGTPVRQELTAAQPVETIAGNAIPPEAWPICTSMDALAEGPAWAPLDPDFAAGKRALAAGDWNGAITALTSAGLRDDRNADIQNYLGYAYRRLRQLDAALRHYRQAATLNPRHRSAHEHLGEAYLILGNRAKAEEHLVALERICLIECPEYDDLKRVLAEYDSR
jgi:tetratricopeptide (TPR) repeat protein